MFGTIKGKVRNIFSTYIFNRDLKWAKYFFQSKFITTIGRIVCKINPGSDCQRYFFILQLIA
ncbi:hypothetical protein KLVA111896_26435 [Klebsiella variicola]